MLALGFGNAYVMKIGRGNDNHRVCINIGQEFFGIERDLEGMIYASLVNAKVFLHGRLDRCQK